MAFPSSPDDDAAAGGLLASERDRDNAPALSISEISALLKRTVEDRFGFVRVRGELSGVKRAASGHVYLCLKDEGARLDGVMWRGNAQRLSFRAEDGVEVVATGKLTTYPGRSNYQIVIDRMEIAGEGALLALLAKTKARLEAEGLFAPERKRPLPFLPRVIGVVTSPTGAVIRDILHRLRDRFPSYVVVWPVMVQGQGSAAQVAAAVRGFSALAPDAQIPRPDLIIVARGGGSIEDLWTFNEEEVVRAATESAIPLISAVGHETDTTLIDHAADLRAPTPTAAAELAVPVLAELGARVSDSQARLWRSVQARIDRPAQRLGDLGRGLGRPQALTDPAQLAFVIEVGGKLAGSTRYGDIRPAHSGLEIGWTWLHPRHMRTGVNPRMKRLLLAHAFEQMHMERVQLKTDIRNTRSQGAIAKLGATREGVLRSHMRRPDGTMRDTVMFSITREEWPQVKANLTPSG